MQTALPADLEALSASAAEREGVLWSLEAGSDLNANLVRFGAGRGVGEHVNDEVDVVFVGVSGTGEVKVDGREHALHAGKLVFVPKGARRSTRGVSEDFAYLTLHGRRGPLRIGVDSDPDQYRGHQRLAAGVRDVGAGRTASPEVGPSRAGASPHSGPMTPQL